MDRPILLIGSDGMLGRAWTRLIACEGLRAQAPPREAIDLAVMGGPAAVTPARILDLLRSIPGPSTWSAPPLVINCAAYTDVDRAESEPDLAHAVNGLGAACLAGACREIGATLVHYSTDYVFDGQSDLPYPTHHPRAPINAYGRSKAAGEEAIEREVAGGLDALIIRTSWLYAPWGRNFVRTISSLARQRDHIRVVNDQHGRPTSAEGLARASLALLAAGARGTLHATDRGSCSWFEFASKIVTSLGVPCRIEPCASSEFPRPARRPTFSVLDVSVTERAIGPLPTWESGLESVLGRLEPVG